MEAAFAFNVSSEEFGLHMKKRFVFRIEPKGMLYTPKKYLLVPIGQSHHYV